MRDYLAIAQKVTEQTGVAFRLATADELQKLRAFGLPDCILNFYASFAPTAQIEGQVMILTVEGLIDENTKYGPGYAIAPLGYVAFADGFCDDPYCFDLNHLNQNGEPRIVLFSHEMVGEGDSPETVARRAKPVATDLFQFLEQFTENKIDEKCSFDT